MLQLGKQDLLALGSLLLLGDVPGKPRDPPFTGRGIMRNLCPLLKPGDLPIAWANDAENAVPAFTLLAPALDQLAMAVAVLRMHDREAFLAAAQILVRHQSDQLGHRLRCHQHMLRLIPGPVGHLSGLKRRPKPLLAFPQSLLGVLAYLRFHVSGDDDRGRIGQQGSKFKVALGRFTSMRPIYRERTYELPSPRVDGEAPARAKVEAFGEPSP